MGLDTPVEAEPNMPDELHTERTAMKHLALAALATAIGVTPAFPQSMPEGHRLAELTFESVDQAGRGFIDQGNMEALRADIFISQDSDENGRISESEMLGWDFGFSNIAEEEDKVLAYRTALRVVFSFWDRNGDGEISETEHRQAVVADFQRADLNNDAVLTEDEFVQGFSVLVAIRAALKPEE